MKKPRLLIAAGSHSEVPLIKAGQSLGFHVITSGHREADVGHSFADEVHLADFSDADAMLALARRLGIDAICAGCNDFSAISSAYVAEQLSLPGHDPVSVARQLHHKDAYRALAKALGIPTPQAVGCSDESQALAAMASMRFPLIIKPVDLTGGKGVLRVENSREAISAAQRALEISRAKRIVVEEFVSGSRHGFSAILRQGRIAFSFADDEYYHLSPYLVSAASSPSSCPASALHQVAAYSETIAQHLRLADGIFHVQFICPDAGDPVIIEICRRAPGDLYVDLVRHATGAPYAQWIVSASAGLSLADVHQMPVRECITRHCLMAQRGGTFAGFDFDDKVKMAITDQMIWAKQGDEVADPASHKFGIVFVRHDSVAERNAQAPLLQNLLRARVY